MTIVKNYRMLYTANRQRMLCGINNENDEVAYMKKALRRKEESLRYRF